MEEDFGLEYLGKVMLVNEIEIRGCEVLICKNPNNEGVIRKGMH